MRPPQRRRADREVIKVRPPSDLSHGGTFGEQQSVEELAELIATELRQFFGAEVAMGTSYRTPPPEHEADGSRRRTWRRVSHHTAVTRRAPNSCESRVRGRRRILDPTFGTFGTDGIARLYLGPGEAVDDETFLTDDA
jgi:hypothetical protein